MILSVYLAGVFLVLGVASSQEDKALKGEALLMLALGWPVWILVAAIERIAKISL